jgi:hypothetical protein
MSPLIFSSLANSSLAPIPLALASVWHLHRDLKPEYVRFDAMNHIQILPRAAGVPVLQTVELERMVDLAELTWVMQGFASYMPKFIETFGVLLEEIQSHSTV